MVLARGLIVLGMVLHAVAAADTASTGSPASTASASAASLALNTSPAAEAAPPAARDIVAAAIDLTRGLTSYAELSMVIHRPDWQRSSSLQAWTRGREDTLIRFTAPPKDAGNATLKNGQKMWTFTPKLNRVIRLPYSMMSQGWAGSDFSYQDLARSDKLLHQYDLELTDTRQLDGHVVYTIEAVPHEDAPVVWGKEEIVIRDDFVLLSETFYDQEMVPLKRLETEKIGTLDGRVLGTRMRMVKLDEPDHWTEINYDTADFDIEIPDELFTVFALKTGQVP